MGNPAGSSHSPLPGIVINLGIFVFCRVVGGMSALCFISLTTPMTDIFIAFRQFRVPEAVIDLMMIIYRTIFILMDQVIQIYHAQIMRLGYSSYRESIQSFAMLCGAAFIAAGMPVTISYGQWMHGVMTGNSPCLVRNRPVEMVPFLTVAVFLVLSAAVVTLSGNITLSWRNMSSIILEARDIRYRYPRGMEAIRGISFHIRRKEKIALVGPNGAGKSTLLMMFNGMIRRIPAHAL